MTAINLLDLIEPTDPEPSPSPSATDYDAVTGHLRSFWPLPMTAAPRPASADLLRIDVGGRARPKGSMRPIGHNRMKEQVKNSPIWRRDVATEAHENVSNCDDPLRCAKTKAGRLCPGLGAGYPSPLAAEVEIDLRFAPLKSLPKWLQALVLLATSRALGDIDKHARNILDALVDAGVLKDDSQVIRLVVAKQYCRSDEYPGASITVRTVGTIDRGRAVLVGEASC